MNSIYDIDLTRFLPDYAKNDSNISALTDVLSKWLRINAELTKQTLIYAYIDNLKEDVLDVLAGDLHVDWYNDDYPIDVKRSIIKDSVKTHKRLGTKYAVETALQNVFPNSTVQEWFEYGGQPFHFKISLDLTDAKAHVDIYRILKTAKSYKRMAAHLEGVYTETDLPPIYIDIHNQKYGVGVFHKATIDWELYFNAVTPPAYVDVHNRRGGVGTFRKASIDWDLFYKSSTVADVGITPDVRVYRRTILLNY